MICVCPRFPAILAARAKPGGQTRKPDTKCKENKQLGAEEVPKGALPLLAVPRISGLASVSACVLLGYVMLSSSVLQAGDAGTVDTLVAVRRILD